MCVSSDNIFHLLNSDAIAYDLSTTKVSFVDASLAFKEK